MSQKRILLIDDEALVVEELTETFEFEGFGVVSASSGEDALTLSGLDEVDVIISDLKMPGLNGLDLYEALRARATFDAPMILLSGHGAQAERDRALDLGIHAFLSKPIDVVELVAVVEDAIEKQNSD